MNAKSLSASPSSPAAKEISVDGKAINRLARRHGGARGTRGTWLTQLRREAAGAERLDNPSRILPADGCRQRGTAQAATHHELGVSKHDSLRHGIWELELLIKGSRANVPHCATKLRHRAGFRWRKSPTRTSGRATGCLPSRLRHLRVGASVAP